MPPGVYRLKQKTLSVTNNNKSAPKFYSLIFYKENWLEAVRKVIDGLKKLISRNETECFFCQTHLSELLGRLLWIDLMGDRFRAKILRLVSAALPSAKSAKDQSVCSETTNLGLKQLQFRNSNLQSPPAALALICAPIFCISGNGNLSSSFVLCISSCWASLHLRANLL